METSNERYMQAMLETIDRHFHETAASTGFGSMPSRVRAAIAATPRHRFVPGAGLNDAYADRPLAIGFGQTISQPFIVAMMTALLQSRWGDKVLEIGTGCGYQAAVLSQLVDHVYTMEIIAPLARRAEQLLAAMELQNVTVVCGNGSAGLTQYAPFDGAIITAAIPIVPAAIISQVRPGGLIVMPLGEPGFGQQLTVLSRSSVGAPDRKDVFAVNFVPFTGV